MSEKELRKDPATGSDQDCPSEPYCSMQSVVPIDSRGQIVLPKDIRAKAKIQAGDKLAVICHESAGEVSCISLIKIDKFTGAVNQMLEPFLKRKGNNKEKEAG